MDPVSLGLLVLPAHSCPERGVGAPPLECHSLPNLSQKEESVEFSNTQRNRLATNPLYMLISPGAGQGSAQDPFPCPVHIWDHCLCSLTNCQCVQGYGKLRVLRGCGDQVRGTFNSSFRAGEPEGGLLQTSMGPQRAKNVCLGGEQEAVGKPSNLSFISDPCSGQTEGQRPEIDTQSEQRF